SREEEAAYTEKLKEQLRENIIRQILLEQFKQINLIITILMSHEKWRKILDESSLNKQIQTIHFKPNGTGKVIDLIMKGDWATSLDLKSAFHHLIIYPPRRPYLAFEPMGKVCQYSAMPFGTQHSLIFFAQALAMDLKKIWRESDIRILNYADNPLLLHQNKERLRKQTLIIIEILEAFGQTIAKEKCEIEPKPQIKFLKWTWDQERMHIKMTDLRKQPLHFQLKRFIKLTERQVPVKIKYLASIIGKLNFFKSQSKRSCFLFKVNGLSKNKSIEEQRMERKYDSTQRSPPRALLMAGSDSEELRDDSRKQISRSSNGIRRIPERLWTGFGTSNRGYFSPTW
ncbi:MAG: hypothetical protein EZS28_050865, partial [Streblomastix strix]